jgi:hypothetical protein
MKVLTVENQFTVTEQFEGHSRLDTIQRYHDCMGFGNYTSDFPDLDCEPYFKIDALKAMMSLPK